MVIELTRGQLDYLMRKHIQPDSIVIEYTVNDQALFRTLYWDKSDLTYNTDEGIALSYFVNAHDIKPDDYMVTNIKYDEDNQMTISSLISRLIALGMEDDW